MTEIDRVDIASANSSFKNMKRLISGAREGEILINPLTKRPYSASRIDQMLREGKDWVADKLVKFAADNPRV